MLKKYILFGLFILLNLGAIAQSKGGFFSQQDRKHSKYFVALGFGTGMAYWNSSLGNTDLYDKNGGIIHSGDLNFKAKNSYESMNLDVQFPVGKMRMGLGIQFEHYFLDKLQIDNPFGGKSYLLFDENFRFDKIYAQVEVPFNYSSDRIWTLNFKGSLGYFGLTGVSRQNFFGEEAVADTYYINLGVIADIKLYPHTYFFMHPNIEYKYFHNSRLENPSEIIHKIFSYGILAGIRIDVSKEY